MIFLKFDRRIFQNFDWTLLALVLGICTVGIINIYSAGYSIGDRPFPLYLKQIQWIFLGLAFMMAIAALSLPEAVMLRRAMKLPLIMTFFGVTTLAIIVTGYIFNALQPVLV